jgi:hypothetical protein
MISDLRDTDLAELDEVSPDGARRAASDRPVGSLWAGVAAASCFGLAIGIPDFFLFEFGHRFLGVSESVLTPAAPFGLSWLAAHLVFTAACAASARIAVDIVVGLTRVAVPTADVVPRLTMSVAFVACAVLGLRVVHQAVPPRELTISGSIAIAIVAVAFAWERRATRLQQRSGETSDTRLFDGFFGIAGVAAVLAVIALLPSGYSTWMRMRPRPGDHDARPNVLIVVLDTVRADRLGCYGSGDARTPTIDRIAAEGVRFTRAFATSPWTFPSHASMWTGLYPSEHGATWDYMRLDADFETLAEQHTDVG